MNLLVTRGAGFIGSNFIRHIIDRSEIRRLIHFVKDRPGHDRRYAIDASKVERELGWKRTHDFEAGLGKTVRWYPNHQVWVETVRTVTKSRNLYEFWFELSPSLADSFNAPAVSTPLRMAWGQSGTV